MTAQALRPSIVLILMTIGCSTVEQSFPEPTQIHQQRGFVARTYHDSLGHQSKYVVFVPETYDSQTPCPTILFLHGAGQVGSDGKAQTLGGLAAAIRNREQTFPFIAIFPQSQAGSWLAHTEDGLRALAILQEVQQSYNVDRERIYLTGYSMGGEGTWSLAAERPHLFAAIVPICPGQNIEATANLKNLPCWCFQGAADDPNLVQNTRSMMLAIQQAGGRPIYQEYPALKHNCWDATYQNDDVFEWLLEQQTNSQD